MSAVSSSDGKRIATASCDGTIRQHVVNLSDLVELVDRLVTREFTEDEQNTYLAGWQGSSVGGGLGGLL